MFSFPQQPVFPPFLYAQKEILGFISIYFAVSVRNFMKRFVYDIITKAYLIIQEYFSNTEVLLYQTHVLKTN